MRPESLGPMCILNCVYSLVESSSLEQTMRQTLDQNIGPSWNSLLRAPCSPWKASFMIQTLDRCWSPCFSNIFSRSSRNLISSCANFASSPHINAQSIRDFAKQLRRLLLLVDIDISVQLATVPGLF